jgi:hypothetical protein
VPHTQIPLKVLWEDNPTAGKVYIWANETCIDTDLEPLREVFGDLMDSLPGWNGRAGRGS